MPPSEIRVEVVCPCCGERYQAAPEGENRLLCGDSTSETDVAQLLAGAAASVVFTSPPYASQREYDATTDFRPIPPDAYSDWYAAVQARIAEWLAPDGSYFLNIKEHCEDGQRHLYVKDLTIAHVRAWGWRFIDEFCWTRAGVPGGWNNRFKNGWEPVFHFARGEQIKFRPDAVSHETEHAFDYSKANGKAPSGSGLLGKEHGARFHEGLARPSNVLRVDTGGGKTSGEHPAEFPVGLPAFFLQAFSDAGDLVYEPFGGSGTTLIAAERLERRCAVMEISPRYCDVVLRRFEAETGRQPVRALAGDLAGDDHDDDE